MEQNNEVVVDRAKSQWSDLWKKEDYWAIWIGFFFLIVAAWLCFGQRPALEARFNEYGTIITAEESKPFKGKKVGAKMKVDINELYKRADYTPIHIHYTKDTERMIDAKAIGAMKRGVRVINLARGEIVDDEAMLTALDTGMVAAYITDFPNNRLLTAPHVIAMPHLGASTPESEQNCAAMAVDTLRDYLESGNIRSSVNLPEMTMDRSGVQRLCVLHKNVPGMLANITSLFGRDGVNVENLSNKSRGDYAYTMVDLGSKVGDNVIEDVRRTANVIRVRSLEW